MLLQIIQCSNIEGALDDLSRRCKLLGPRSDERMHPRLEIWKYDRTTHPHPVHLDNNSLQVFQPTASYLLGVS